MGLMQWIWTLLTGSRLKASMIEGKRLLGSGDHLQALEVFRAVTHEWPARPEGYEGMSKAYKAMGLRPEERREAAIAESLVALENNSDDINARTVLAEAYLQKDAFGWAASHIDHAFQSAPHNREVVRIAAEAFTKNRNYSKAVKALKEAVRLDPLEADLYAKLALNLRATNQAVSAMKAAAIAQALKEAAAEPGNSEVVDKAVRNFQNQGQSGLALILVERCLKGNPQVPGLHRLRGELLAESHQTREAITALKKSLSLDPTDLKAHRILAKAYIREGMAEQADHHQSLAAIIAQAQKSEDPLEAAVAMLKVQIEGGDLDSAQAQAEENMRAHPNDWRSFFMMGMVLKGRKKNQEAMQALNRACKINDFAAQVHLEIAILQSEMGEVLEAVGEARKAVNLDPRRPEYRMALAKILRQHGYLDQAVEEEEVAESLFKRSSGPN